MLAFCNMFGAKIGASWRFRQDCKGHPHADQQAEEESPEKKQAIGFGGGYPKGVGAVPLPGGGGSRQEYGG